jgi:hypothetical protein
MPKCGQVSERKIFSAKQDDTRKIMKNITVRTRVGMIADGPHGAGIYTGTVIGFGTTYYTYHHKSKVVPRDPAIQPPPEWLKEVGGPKLFQEHDDIKILLDDGRVVWGVQGDWQTLIPQVAVDGRLSLLLSSIEDFLGYTASPRLLNCLQNADIRVVGQLVQRSEKDLLRIRNLGRKTVAEIRTTMINCDLDLAMVLDADIRVLIDEAAEEVR